MEASNYQLMVIASSNKESEKVATFVEKTLKEAEATDLKLDKLGRRVLAYPIENQNECEYFVFNFNAGGEAINKVNDVLRIEKESVLRYLLTKVKISKKVKKGVQTKMATEGNEEPDAGVKSPVKAKVTVKAKSNVVVTKIVAKKASKVVKKSKENKEKE